MPSGISSGPGPWLMRAGNTRERHCMTSFSTERQNESLGSEGRRVAMLGDGTEEGGPIGTSGMLGRVQVVIPWVAQLVTFGVCDSFLNVHRSRHLNT